MGRRRGSGAPRGGFFATVGLYQLGRRREIREEKGITSGNENKNEIRVHELNKKLNG